MSTELVFKIINAIKACASELDENRAFMAVESIMDHYTVAPKETLPAVMTDMPDMIRMFLASKARESRLSKQTVRNYAYTLRRFSDFIYKPVAQITHHDIRAYLDKMRFKSNTQETIIYCIKSFFGWLIREEILIKNPTLKIVMPKKERTSRESLTVEQLEKVRNACVTDRERAIVEVYISTGCRLSELVGKKLTDIKGDELLVTGKGSKDRYVYLNDKAMMYLRKYVMSRGGQSDSIFLSTKMKNGQYYSIGGATIGKEVREIGKRAGVHLTPHIFRHTCATFMVNSGASIDDVQEFLGHEDPKTTKIYAKTNRTMLKFTHKKYATA